MANFKVAYDKTSIIEGGYANDPADNGGETYKGIARKFWPAWKGWAIIDVIKRTQGKAASIINKAGEVNRELQSLVLSFYKANFWDSMNLDKMKSQDIANELYDTGVNMGYKVGVEFLQRILNAINNPDILVDGDLGTSTLSRCNSLNEADTKIVVKFLNHLQGAKYLDIVEHNRSQEKFIRSWASRT
jgi:lysozyme family protein